MIITGCSEKNDYRKAAAEIKEQLNEFSEGLILFFASSHYPSSLLSREMKSYYPDAVVIGCTSAGELCNRLVLNHSITAMAISNSIIGQYSIGILENFNDMSRVKSLFNSFQDYFNEPYENMSEEDYLGLVLVDGLSNKEEQLLENMNDLCPIPFIGGSAGDNLNFHQTHIFFEGNTFTGGALLLLAKPNVPFVSIKTQSFDILPDTLVCTKADYDKRIVYEINHRPATTAYAEILGVKENKLEEYFNVYPLGQVIDDDPYVRSPRNVEGTTIHFYAGIMPGKPYHLLKANSIIADTKIKVAEQAMKLGHIDGLINFHCILRTKELTINNQLDNYGEIFRNIPSIGFSTYGEIYKNYVNQTSTMILFGH